MKDFSDHFIVDEDDGCVAYAEIRVAAACKAAEAGAEHHAGRSLAPVADATAGEAGSETPLDAHKLGQRQKQIDFGKNTLGYQRYLLLVPRDQRTLRDPKTPDVHAPISKRAFDGQVRVWRRALHQYDEGGVSCDDVRDQEPSARHKTGRRAAVDDAVCDADQHVDVATSAAPSPAPSVGSLDGYLFPADPVAGGSRKRALPLTEGPTCGGEQCAQQAGDGRPAQDLLSVGVEAKAGQPEPKRSTASRGRDTGGVCTMSILGPSGASNPAMGATSGLQPPAGAPLAEVQRAGLPSPRVGARAGLLSAATSFAGISASVGVAAAGVTGVRSACLATDEDNVVNLILNGDGSSCMSWQDSRAPSELDSVAL